MGNTCAFIRQLKEVDLSNSCKMSRSSESDSRLADPSAAEHAITSRAPHLSARSQSLTDRKSTQSGACTSTEEQIQRSKSHWSQLVEHDSDDDEVAEISNVQVFKTLQSHPTWGVFFCTFREGELVMGEKFAEGGQAELYEAQVNWNNPRMNERDQEYGDHYVLKVFKKGTLLRHLQTHLPEGLLQFKAEIMELAKLRMPKLRRYYCDVVHGTLLKDGRFAFLLIREHIDLRSFIDRKMPSKSGHDCRPFSEEAAEYIMYEVAKGMDRLHNRNIIHRDLKACNVLVREHDDSFRCYVADYECSIGVIGTGFFRAFEILQACRNGNVGHRPDLFTREADVYSYGMTCYEILTGKLPFQGHSQREYDMVLNGQLPEVPKYVNDWTRGFLSRCWHSNLKARPSFGDILNLLVANSAVSLKIIMAKFRWKKDQKRKKHY